MKRTARRAFTLVHLLMMLPLFAAMITVGFELVISSARLQSRTLKSLEDDAAVTDIVRRVQQDAAAAREAEVEPMEAGTRLVLTGGADRIVYEAAGTRVQRTGPTADGPVSDGLVADGPSRTITWALREATPGFAIEAVDASPGVVWITWDITAQRQVGPDQVRHLAAAAAVGRGGR